MWLAFQGRREGRLDGTAYQGFALISDTCYEMAQHDRKGRKGSGARDRAFVRRAIEFAFVCSDHRPRIAHSAKHLLQNVIELHEKWSVLPVIPVHISGWLFFFFLSNCTLSSVVYRDWLSPRFRENEQTYVSYTVHVSSCRDVVLDAGGFEEQARSKAALTPLLINHTKDSLQACWKHTYVWSTHVSNMLQVCPHGPRGDLRSNLFADCLV